MSGIPAIRLVCGSARCGTYGASRILMAQPFCHAGHENVPLYWDANTDPVNFYAITLRWLLGWNGAPFYCNSSFAWMGQMGQVMRTFRDPRVVCLRRPKDKTVASILAHWPEENFWTDPDSTFWDGQYPRHKFTEMHPTEMSKMWPKYDLPKEDAVAAYWDEYYSRARYWSERLPDNFMVVEFDHFLNTEDGQAEVFDFFGFPVEGREYYPNLHLNSHDEARGVVYREENFVFGPQRVYEEAPVS